MLTTVILYSLGDNLKSSTKLLSNEWPEGGGALFREGGKGEILSIKCRVFLSGESMHTDREASLRVEQLSGLDR